MWGFSQKLTKLHQKTHRHPIFEQNMITLFSRRKDPKAAKFQVQLDVARAIVQLDGRQLKKEPHAHACQRTKGAIAAARGAVVGPRIA